MAARDLWPGFDPRTMPVAIFDGRQTWLFRHPSAPEGFEADPEHPGVRIFPGRHPSVTANTSTSLGGSETAVLLLDSIWASRTALAAVLIHESFHSFQRRRHPTWTANEVELFTYPADAAEALAVRRLETEALRRALAAASGAASACWTREALDARARRFARLPPGAVAYERGIEVVEGLAEYVEYRARNVPAPVAFPRAEYPADAVRQRGYAVGLAFARLLDRFAPAWREDLERRDSTTLDSLLGVAVRGRADSAASCAFGAAALEAARRDAVRDVAALHDQRAALRRAFLARSGWTLVIEAEHPPLYPEGFDPLNVRRLSGGEILHTRWLKLGGPAGMVEVMGRAALTRAAGTHPIFEGVRSLTVAGLPGEPAVTEAEGRVTIVAEGVRASLVGATVERQEGARTLRVLAAATPPSAAAQGDSTWQDHNRAGVLALRARDWPAYRYHHLRLDTLLRGLPLIQLRLASVEARLGRPEAALRRLERYAAMGLTANLAADSALAPLRGLPGWAPVAERIARNAEPVRRADTVVVLPSRDMMAEDIAYDPRSGRFFVSSMRERRILAVDRNGGTRDFVASGQDGIWAAVDLGVDARRRLLWVTTDALAFQVGYDSAEAGRAAIIAYDLGTGRLVRRIDAPRDTAHFLGDLAVAPTGEVYVSDNTTRAVYVVRSDADSLEVLVPPGVLANPQNPALSPDGRRLFVADYLLGIAVVDLASRRVDWLPQPPDVATNGIDGLYVAGRSLIGVQNGTAPERIVRFPVDEGFTRILGWEVLEQNPQLDEPTHGVVVGDAFYFIANSGDERARGATVRDDPAARPPAVMRVRLR